MAVSKGTRVTNSYGSPWRFVGNILFIRTTNYALFCLQWFVRTIDCSSFLGKERNRATACPGVIDFGSCRVSTKNREKKALSVQRTKLKRHTATAAWARQLYLYWFIKHLLLVIDSSSQNLPLRCGPYDRTYMLFFPRFHVLHHGNKSLCPDFLPSIRIRIRNIR